MEGTALFSKKAPEKEITDTVEEKAKSITMIHYLDSHVINTGLSFDIVYSFVVTYRDGHCGILEAKAQDPLLNALLPKLL